MDIQTRKIEFVQAFLKLQNEKLISRFEKLLNKEATLNKKIDFKPMSIEEFSKRIDKSENDIKNGRYKTTKQLLSKY